MIEHGKHGLLVDIFYAEKLAEFASQVLDRLADYKPLRHAGIQMIRERYSLDICLPRMLALSKDAVHARRGGIEFYGQEAQMHRIMGDRPS
jgi:hypothetical protein